jgi:hypothetical protein
MFGAFTQISGYGTGKVQSIFVLLFKDKTSFHLFISIILRCGRIFVPRKIDTESAQEV